MIKLGGSQVEFINFNDDTAESIIALSGNSALASPLRSSRGFIITSGPVPSGFRAYIVFASDRERAANLPLSYAVAVLPDEYRYLAEGDVLRLNPKRASVRVLFRKSSPHNWFLLTERCNNYCLMCSQPPKPWDDSWIVDEVLQALPLIDPDTREIGFSGGEPTLLGDNFIKILRSARSWLPRTAIHVLSNGRAFSEQAFAEKYAMVGHPDLMIGIPIYSDLSHVHDYVVQADGAFDETIRGILNLKRLRQLVEVRVVIHAQTYRRLPQIADFLVRNLLFVDHVALMGLEMTGFTKANLDDLWIDPYDYQEELEEAVRILSAHRMNVSVYNHQLCILRPSLWRYARKSISDWKNIYMPECEGCAKKADCGGFFASATLRYSEKITAFNRE